MNLSFNLQLFFALVAVAMLLLLLFSNLSYHIIWCAEMIVESRPLHKKKKRLAKQRSLRDLQTSPSCDPVSLFT